MNGGSIRRLFAALVLAAGIGLCQPAMAQQNDDEEAPTLASLMQDLEEALEALRSLEAQVRALRAQADEEGRKTLVPRIPTGLSRSTETPVFSEKERERLDSETGPGLAELLPDSGVRFPALSAALRRDFSSSRVELSDGAHVKAISSDGEGGFQVTYEIEGEERTVHFAASDYRPDFRNYSTSVGSTDTYLLWAYEDSFTRDGTNRNQGSSRLSYVDGHGSVVPGYRVYMSYGARTETGDLPASTATYAGRFEGETFSRNDPNFATGRSYIDGNLNLTADFENGAIDGRINRIGINPPGPDGYKVLSSSTRFDIGRGRIVDGQFLATLTGVDSNPDAAIEDTVAGYRGDILGEFYGPAGEELGGVLNAESDVHDSVIGGWFGGRQLRAVVPAGASSAPSSAGVERDFTASTVQAADDSGVTSISSDGEGGYNVSYRIDGVEHAVQLPGSAYGANGRFPTSYQTATESNGYFLFSAVDSFFGNSEYDHFDVAGWASSVLRNDGSGAATWVGRGLVVHGVRTESAELPTGEASYDGRMRGEIWDSDKTASDTRTGVRGDLSLTADFDDDTVSGTIDGIETRAPDQTAYRSSTEILTIGAGTITDSMFAATLAGTGGASSRYEGDVEGQFFGPDAIEVGGVLQATHTGNSKVMIGWFGGKRDDIAEVATSQ